ncbi:MAG: hypothetical protein U0359_23005 [Byssovorax sp.]
MSATPARRPDAGLARRAPRADAPRPALLDTEQESEAEREVPMRSVQESPIMQALAPTLLSAEPPTKRALAEQIERVSGLSRATAAHRASDLLAWREQLLQQRLDLPAGPSSEGDEGAPPSHDAA